MNFLITMKLSDRSLWNHIFPITNLNDISTITIIRDTSGIPVPKVRYITPFHDRVTESHLMVLIKGLHIMWYSLIEKPSLIHAYLLYPHGYLAFIAGKLTGRKVGVSLIAGPVETYLFGDNPIEKYAYCQPLPPSTTTNRLILSVLKRFDVITVTGTYTRNFLVSRGIDEHKIFILPHVVDERFRPLAIKKDYDVIYVGGLDPAKHVETVIKAISIVKKALPSIKVVIVGDGESQSNLEELTRSLDLTGQIDFVGYQTNTWEWYNRSKISVSASEREGFPYTVIESLKCNVPPIVSNCGDVGDIVKDSFNGKIVADYRDHTAFADIIIDLLTHPDLLKKYSENCQQTSDDLNFMSVESVWEKIIMEIERKPAAR
jgi:glycosyltransferase involved in cell wall biosynthesis